MMTDEEKKAYDEMVAAIAAKNALNMTVTKSTFTGRIGKRFLKYQEDLDKMLEIAAQEYLKARRKSNEENQIKKR